MYTMYTTYMPQVHTYIRNEDMELWKSLPNKSEFIHNALNGFDLRKDYTEKLTAKIDKSPILNIPNLITADKLESIEPTLAPCCKKASPCRQWKYNELNQTYVNTLTGEVKEVM